MSFAPRIHTFFSAGGRGEGGGWALVHVRCSMEYTWDAMLSSVGLHRN